MKQNLSEWIESERIKNSQVIREVYTGNWLLQKPLWHRWGLFLSWLFGHPITNCKLTKNIPIYNLVIITEFRWSYKQFEWIDSESSKTNKKWSQVLRAVYTGNVLSQKPWWHWRGLFLSWIFGHPITNCKLTKNISISNLIIIMEFRWSYKQ